MAAAVGPLVSYLLINWLVGHGYWVGTMGTWRRELFTGTGGALHGSYNASIGVEAHAV